jgi:SagB-type dehydrogenase family enzyme
MSLIYLPPPQKLSTMTVEEAILLRRSIREFKEDPIRLEHLSMILWAAYGITDPSRSFRASPSAGATYPLELYIVVGGGGVYISNNTYLDPGIYKYNPYVHGLTNIKKGDFRKELMKASLYQKWVEDAPISIVICAVYDRTTRYYGERGRTRYVPIDVGHVGQNIYLMATALGYGTVAIGAFKDSEVSKVIDVKPDETPLYIMPIGVPKSKTLVSFNDIELFLNKSR